MTSHVSAAAAQSPLYGWAGGDQMAHAVVAALEQRFPGKVYELCKGVDPSWGGPQNRLQDDILYSAIALNLDAAGALTFDASAFFAESQDSVNNSLGTLTGLWTNLKTANQLPQGAAFTAKRIGFDIGVYIPPAGDQINAVTLEDALFNNVGFSVKRGDNILNQGGIKRYTMPGTRLSFAQGDLAAGAQTSIGAVSPNPIGWDDMREWDPPRAFDAGTFNLPVEQNVGPTSPFPNVAFANATAIAVCYMQGIWSRPIPT